MFETTLIASRRQKGLRQRLLALPAAIALHGIALSAFLVGQLWADRPGARADAAGRAVSASTSAVHAAANQGLHTAAGRAAFPE